jgi:histidine ammonia-lyase
MKQIVIDGNSLSISDIFNVVFNEYSIELSAEAKQKIIRSRDLIDKWVKNDSAIYGVTTGFGEFANVKINATEIEQLQKNLIHSHAAGTGSFLPIEVVKAMLLLRINTLIKGYSGIRLETVEFMIKMLNNNIIPLIPSQGSVGASGDLVPLSHLVISMMGHGFVVMQKKLSRSGSQTVSQKSFNYKLISSSSVELQDIDIIPALSALEKIGLKPLTLKAKEGLALINGTQMMSAYLSLCTGYAIELMKTIDIASALSIEALKGSDTPFDERIHQLRPHKGQQQSASNIRRLLAESEIRESHRLNHDKIQDAYSLRCIPQVHGASRDAILYVKGIIETEINSVTDNPLIFPEHEAHLEGGNFHGQPIALASDFLGIALSEFANISERRVERLLNGSLSGLPRFLTTNGGLNSGFMIVQYTAASLVSENKVLAHPASVDSIPTSANQEDHNSMGSIAARKCYQILQNAQNVIAIEMLCAAQGIDFHKPYKCGKGTGVAHNLIREHIPYMTEDRIFYDDIQSLLGLVKEGTILKSVEHSIGELS